jgi:hypothetical protein
MPLQKHLLLISSLFDRLIQIGPSELQAAGLDPCLAEVFVTAGDLGLSPALKLCHHSTSSEATSLEGPYRAHLRGNASIGRKKQGFSCVDD